MQRIEIHNFRQIASANVQVNDLTVVIGEQASGKSTIAKLVYFFKSLRKDLVEMSRSREDINGLKISNKVRDKFYLYFGSTARLAEDYSIKFFFDVEKSITIRGQRPPDVRFEPQGWFNEIEKEIKRATVLVSHYIDRENLTAVEQEVGILDDAMSTIFGENSDTIYIPAGRNITVSYTDEFLALFSGLVKVKTEVQLGADGLPKRNDAEEIDLILLRDFMLHSSNLRKSYRGVGMNGMLDQIGNAQVREGLAQRILGLLKANYRYNTTRGEFLVLENGITRELSKASSGQQEAIRIVQDAILQIADAEAVFRVIEEPEAHLFPSGQRNMMEILAALINTKPEKGLRDNQIFITTHSPYILNILNNLIFAGDLSANGASDAALKAAGIPEIFSLKPQQVSAYMLTGEGQCEPINDTAKGDLSENATGAIGGNVLENYWNDLQNQFDDLMELSV